MQRSTRELAYTAMAAAVVAVTTMAVQVPVPQTRGYINLGDTMVFVFALLFGAKVGALGGGLGSALADILTGYAHWAPFTLIIKGCEGYIVGRFARPETHTATRFLFLVLAGMQMAGGYFLAGGVLYGFGPALVELPGNILQGSSAVVLAPLIVYILLKTERSLLHRS